MNNFPPPYPGFDSTRQQALDARVSGVMRRVYVKMTIGLLVTALVAMWGYSTPAVAGFFLQNPGVMWGIIIAELVLVFAISGGINRMSSSTATLLFYLFAVVNGLSLFPIFMIYTHTSIAKTFFITAGTFGAMSIFGYTTKQDLTRFGSILVMALFGLIIAVVVNLFVRSTQLDWIISIVGVILFVGLTAWDTQQVKNMAAQAPVEMTGKLATLGALSLYLDFINLFLYLLRFFGNSRD